MTVVVLMTTGLAGVVHAADYSSNLLSQVQPYYTSSAYYGRYQEGEASMGGQTYADSFMLNSFNNINTEAAFYLEGKYKSISFSVGHVQATSMNPRTLTVYCDDKIVWQSNIAVEDLPHNSGTISLSGVQELKFVLSGSSSSFWTAIGNINLTSGGYTREERMKPITSNLDVAAYSSNRYSVADVVMGDKNFEDALKFNSYNSIEAYAVYNLQNNYRTLSFWVGNERNSVDLQTRTVTVTGDGVKLYSKDVCADDAPVYASVPVAGVSQLKISVSGTPSSYHTVVGGVNLVGNPINITKATVTVEDTVYAGKALKPKAAVTYNGKVLIENTDYTVSYLNNTAAGTGTAVITGIGNYTGSVTATFTIEKADISRAAATVANASYTGKALTPKAVVKDNGTVLSVNTDYSVSYSNNIKIGTGKVVFTGKGNYKGSVTKTFTIEKADQKLTVKVSSKTLVVGKTAKITANAKGKITYQTKNKKIATVTSKGKITAKSPGKVKITVKAAGGSTYKAVSKTFEIIVNPKSTKITSTKNGSKGKVTVKWNKVSSITGYQIKYVTGSVTKNVLVKKASVKSLTLKNLTKGKTYKIYVRTYKNVSGINYYSSWSKVKSIKVKK